MRRKHALVGVGISLLVTVGIVWIISNPLSRLNHQTRCPDCNIILFSVDTLRADHLGIYGYQRPTSPNIDHFFASRVVFKDCYATSSWTLPSHVSMLTGLYSKNHGAFCRACQLSDTKTTMADVLHKEGYATAAFTGGGFVSKSFNYHTFDVFNDVGNIDGRNFGDMLGWVSGHADDRFAKLVGLLEKKKLLDKTDMGQFRPYSSST